VTGFGWLLVVKAVICFLFPEQALRSMERGGKTPRSFVVAGLVLLTIGSWACWHLDR